MTRLCAPGPSEGEDVVRGAGASRAVRDDGHTRELFAHLSDQGHGRACVDVARFDDEEADVADAEACAGVAHPGHAFDRGRGAFERLNEAQSQGDVGQ